MSDQLDPDVLGPAIEELHRRRDEDRRRAFDRSLSFDEVVSDRWARAARLGFGKDASIYGSALVFGEVTVGDNTWVGPWVLLDGSGGGVRIGAYCSISAGVQIYTHDTVIWALSGGARDRAIGRVSIGDCCHVGAQSIVRAGVTIGSHCVIGANSFVNEDVPDRSVVVGSPAQRIGRVEGSGADVRIVLDPHPGR